MKKYFLLSSLLLSSLSFADQNEVAIEESSVTKQIVNQVNELKKRIAQIEQKTEKSTSSAFSQGKNLEKQQKTLEEQFYQIHSKVVKREEEISQLKNELAALSQQSIALQSRLQQKEASESDVIAVSEKLEKLYNELIQTTSTTVGSLQNSQKDITAQINQLKQGLAEEKQINTVLQNQLKAQMALTKEHAALHDIAQNEISALKGLNAYIQNSLQAEESRRAELFASFEKLQATFDETEKRIDRKDQQEKSKHQAMTARMENLLQQIEDLQRKMTKR